MDSFTGWAYVLLTYFSRSACSVSHTAQSLPSPSKQAITSRYSTRQLSCIKSTATPRSIGPAVDFGTFVSETHLDLLVTTTIRQAFTLRYANQIYPSKRLAQ